MTLSCLHVLGDFGHWLRGYEFQTVSIAAILLLLHPDEMRSVLMHFSVELEPHLEWKSVGDPETDPSLRKVDPLRLDYVEVTDEFNVGLEVTPLRTWD